MSKHSSRGKEVLYDSETLLRLVASELDELRGPELRDVMESKEDADTNTQVDASSPNEVSGVDGRAGDATKP